MVSYPQKLNFNDYTGVLGPLLYPLYFPGLSLVWRESGHARLALAITAGVY